MYIYIVYSEHYRLILRCHNGCVQRRLMFSELDEWLHVAIANEPSRWDTLPAAIAFLQIVECKLLAMSRAIGDSRAYATNNTNTVGWQRRRSSVASSSDGVATAAQQTAHGGRTTGRRRLRPKKRHHLSALATMSLTDARYLDLVTRRDLRFIGRVVRRRLVVLESRTLLLRAYREAINGRIRSSWRLMRQSWRAAEWSGSITDRSWVGRNCLSWYGMSIDDALVDFDGRRRRKTATLNVDGTGSPLSPARSGSGSSNSGNTVGFDQTAGVAAQGKLSVPLVSGTVSGMSTLVEVDDDSEDADDAGAAAASEQLPASSHRQSTSGETTVDEHLLKPHKVTLPIEDASARSSTPTVDPQPPPPPPPPPVVVRTSAPDELPFKPRMRSRSIADAYAEMGYGVVIGGRAHASTDDESRWEKHAETDFPLVSAFEGVGVETFMSLKFALPLPIVFTKLAINRQRTLIKANSPLGLRRVGRRRLSTD